MFEGYSITLRTVEHPLMQQLNACAVAHILITPKVQEHFPVTLGLIAGKLLILLRSFQLCPHKNSVLKHFLGYF